MVSRGKPGAPKEGWTQGSVTLPSWPPRLCPTDLYAPTRTFSEGLLERPLPSTVGTGHTEPHSHADCSGSRVAAVGDARAHEVPGRLPQGSIKGRGCAHKRWPKLPVPSVRSSGKVLVSPASSILHLPPTLTSLPVPHHPPAASSVYVHVPLAGPRLPEHQCCVLVGLGALGRA